MVCMCVCMCAHNHAFDVCQSISYLVICMHDYIFIFFLYLMDAARSHANAFGMYVCMYVCMYVHICAAAHCMFTYMNMFIYAKQ